MKRIFTVLVTLALFCTAMIVASAAATTVEMVALKTETAPTIDGVFNDSEWAPFLVASVEDVNDSRLDLGTTFGKDADIANFKPFEIYVTHTDDFVYFCLVVADDQHTGDEKISYFLADTVGSSGYPGWTAQVKADGTTYSDINNDNYKVAVQRDEANKKTVYEIAASRTWRLDSKQTNLKIALRFDVAGTSRIFFGDGSTKKAATPLTLSSEVGTFTPDVPDTHEHSFTNYVPDNNATCGADGTKTAKCDTCDVTDTVVDEGTKLQHSFTNYVFNKDATVEADGTETAKCDQCSATDTRTAVGTKLDPNVPDYSKSKFVAYETNKAPKIDGKFSAGEWEGFKIAEVKDASDPRLNLGNTFGTDADIANFKPFEIYVTHTDDFVYFCLVVADDQHTGDEQIAYYLVDTVGSAGYPGWTAKLKADGTTYSDINNDNYKVAVQRDEANKKTVYEIAASRTWRLDSEQKDLKIALRFDVAGTSRIYFGDGTATQTGVLSLVLASDDDTSPDTADAGLAVILLAMASLSTGVVISVRKRK